MTYSPEMVSADPGPEPVLVANRPDKEKREAVHPIVGGLAATADDPEESEPLDHPQLLLGELPALGSNENPG